jgi:hypothetical protein
MDDSPLAGFLCRARARLTVDIRAKLRKPITQFLDVGFQAATTERRGRDLPASNRGESTTPREAMNSNAYS